MRRQRVYLPPGMDPDDLPDPRDLAEDAADFAAEQKAARQRRRSSRCRSRGATVSDVTLPTGDRLVAEIRRLRGLNRDPHVATLQLALGLGRTGVDYHARSSSGPGV